MSSAVKILDFKDVYDRRGVTVSVTAFLPYEAPLSPIPVSHDAQTIPPRFELLRAALEREISSLFWGRNSLPRPIAPLLQRSWSDIQFQESQTACSPPVSGA